MLYPNLASAELGDERPRTASYADNHYLAICYLPLGLDTRAPCLSPTVPLVIWGCRFAGRASCSLQCGTAFAGTGADAARSTGGEHVSRLHGLSGPNAHCVGSIVVECKGEESEGSF